MSFEVGRRRTRFVTSPSAAKLASISETPLQSAASSSITRNSSVKKLISKEARPLLQPEKAVSHNGEFHARELDEIDGISSQEHYRVYFRISLGCNKNIAVGQKTLATSSKDAQGALLWNLSGSNAQAEVAIVQSIRHENFVKALAIYGAGDEFTVAFEFVPLSLSEVIVNRRLNESELACILKQAKIANGLLYLERKGLGHSKLTCSNVLIDHGGHVKIWGQQHCSQHSHNDLSEGLCLMTAQLIAGREAVNPDEFSYGMWTPPSEVVDFFELTKKLKNSEKNMVLGSGRRNQMERISQHPLLAKAGAPHSLEMFLHLVRYTTRWLVRCSEVAKID